MNVARARGASSGGTTQTNQRVWFKCARPVNRLQAHIVKAARKFSARTGFAHAGLRSGLSRMKGNFHVRFLGEGAAATPRPYPTTVDGFDESAKGKDGGGLAQGVFPSHSHIFRQHPAFENDGLPHRIRRQGLNRPAKRIKQ